MRELRLREDKWLTQACKSLFDLVFTKLTRLIFCHIFLLVLPPPDLCSNNSELLIYFRAGVQQTISHWPNLAHCLILLEHSHAHFLTHCLWLLSCYDRVEQLQQKTYDPQSLTSLLPCSSQKMFADTCSRVFTPPDSCTCSLCQVCCFFHQDVEVWLLTQNPLRLSDFSRS